VGVTSEGTATAETLSIDDLVRRQGLSRVDFIKMDIEGAELSALQGAAETLRAFRPKLALALYHKLEDWTTIPQYLRTLHSYRFFVDHFSTRGEETVLFAVP
jgi:Methyltransferase FkbM domain